MINRKSVLLDTCHISPMGGGENYLMRFAMQLNKISDFYIRNNFNSNFQIYNGFGETFKEFKNDFKPDIHIQCNYNYITTPLGYENIIITFFPKHDLIPVQNMGILESFDIVTICPYSQKYVKEYWGKNSTVIFPAIDPIKYFNTGGKRKHIVSIGHFFMEEDGHSKNQHVLIKAKELLPEYSLTLIGNANSSDMGYVQELKSIAGLDTSFLFNTDVKTINRTLAMSEFLWHANGYMRTDPAQTEHFGIVVLEALASGCIPIVHNSGGAKDIRGAHSWNTVDELVEKTKALHDLKPFTILEEKYTLSYFNREVTSWLASL